MEEAAWQYSGYLNIAPGYIYGITWGTPDHPKG